VAASVSAFERKKGLELLSKVEKCTVTYQADDFTT